MVYGPGVQRIFSSYLFSTLRQIIFLSFTIRHFLILCRVSAYVPFTGWISFSFFSVFLFLKKRIFFLMSEHFEHTLSSIQVQYTTFFCTILPEKIYKRSYYLYRADNIYVMLLGQQFKIGTYIFWTKNDASALFF